MALTQKTFGPVTIDDVVSMTGFEYFLFYWDERYQIVTYYGELVAARFEVRIPEAVVKAEALKRNKMIGRIPSFEDGEEVDLIHEISYEEWSEDVDYREEFEKFVQELAIESLNLDVFQLQEELKEANALVQSYTGELLDLKLELQKYKALAVTENKMVVLYEPKDSIGKIGKTYKKQA